MDTLSEQLGKLEDKIRRISRDHKRINEEYDQLIKQAVIYQKTIEDQQAQIIKLESQVGALKIAKRIDSKEDTGKIRDRIDDLVREIDRCIELLNK